MIFVGDRLLADHSYWSQLTPGNAGISIAVLDGPVDTAHPCLVGAALEVHDYFGFSPKSGGKATAHGTQISSIIFGQPGTSLEGIAPRCRGVLVPIFHDSEDGNIQGASQMMLASGIEYAIELGAHIVNISGGQISSDSSADSVLERAIGRCQAAGVLIVSAAGNEGCACLRLPAALPSVFAVGAHDAVGRPLSSCNYGAAYRNNGLLAPGENVPVAGHGLAVETESGTSFATALVTGLIGRICSALLQRGDKANPILVADVLMQTASDCNIESTDEGCSPWPGRRLNIRAALQAFDLISSSCSNDTTLPKREEEVMTVINNGESDGKPIKSGAVLEPSGSLLPPPSFQPAKGEGCSCGGGGASQLVYALGQVTVDFGTEARRDALTQNMESWGKSKNRKSTLNPLIAQDLVEFLNDSPHFDQGLTWVLNLDTTPIYALKPAGMYAAEVSHRLREAYKLFNTNDPDSRIELISVPGYTQGSVRLANGYTVPVLYPDLRGMYDWNIGSLAQACADGICQQNNPPSKSAPQNEVAEALKDFLSRVYFELRNLGQSSADRALNFAATHAFQFARVFERAIKDRLVLRDPPSVVKSPICRPESDCYDVILTFFDPEHRLTRASRAYRFTVDVSEVLPVMVGPERSWPVSQGFIA